MFIYTMARLNFTVEYYYDNKYQTMAAKYQCGLGLVTISSPNVFPVQWSKHLIFFRRGMFSIS